MKLVIPSDVRFCDLHLKREMDGEVAFEWWPLERVCEANGIDPEAFAEEDEGAVVELIVVWYQVHRECGGEPDLVQEQIMAEVLAEEKFGRANVMRGPARLQ